MTANETADHAWVREHVATYLAAGLADDERGRFEAHIGSCGSCLADLQDAQATERSLTGLFAADRPAPGLEDRIIRSLAAAPRRRIPIAWVRAASAVAAVFLLAVAGFFFEAAVFPKNGSPPKPGGSMVHFPNGVVLGFSPTEPDKRTTPLVWGRRPSEAGEHYRGTLEEDRVTAPSAAEMAKAKGDELSREWKVRRKDPFFKSMRDVDVQRQPAADPKPESEVGPGFTSREAEKKERGELARSYDRLPRLGDTDFVDHDKGLDGAGVDLDARWHDQSGRLEGNWFKPGAEAQNKAVEDSHRDVKKFVEESSKAEAAPVTAKDLDKHKVQDAPQSQRKIIRQGEMEFEVESFDSSVDKVAAIAQEEKGYVATVNSDRLPNGKVKGTVVLRIPPDALDRLVLKLRALGDLKSQRITSEDITKKYTDLESHLRAARTMEARLIEIIKSGKGEIKDILAAEKELGTWREKIELYEGELRFYANLISLSTLTLTLAEKDIRSPSVVTVTETVDTGIEAEDVPKADRDLRALIAEAKGRITASDLKKLAADQFSLTLACEVPPENAGPLRDRLNQVGRLARLDVQTKTSDDGRGRPPDGKEKRNDTVFRISVYNTTNVQPRETSVLNLACLDVEASFRAILSRVTQAGGRVIQSNLNQVKADQFDGVVLFDVPVKEGEAVLEAVRKLGEVMTFKVIENPDSANVTKSKKGFQVSLLAMAHVVARETVSLRVAARDVGETYGTLQGKCLEKKGRVLDARFAEETRDRVTASLELEVPRDDRALFEEILAGAGGVISRNVQRAPDDGRVVDSKVRLSISLQTIASVGPRRTVKLGVETSNVDGAAERLSAHITGNGGQLVDSQNTRDPNGRAISFLAFEAPMDKIPGFVDLIRKAGTVRLEETRRNPSAPETGPAIGRIDLTLSNEDPIVGGDAGFGAQLKDAMRSVIAAAGFSLKFIVVGALVVVPWALLVWFGWKLVRRFRNKPAAGV